MAALRAYISSADSAAGVGAEEAFAIASRLANASSPDKAFGTIGGATADGPAAYSLGGAHILGAIDQHVSSFVARLTVTSGNNLFFAVGVVTAIPAAFSREPPPLLLHEFISALLLYSPSIALVLCEVVGSVRVILLFGVERWDKLWPLLLPRQHGLVFHITGMYGA